MKNYREAECCGSCQHVFCLQDWESNPEHYCTFERLPRPKSDCQANGELDHPDFDSEKWHDWAEDASVEPECVCDNFSKNTVILIRD